MSYSTFCLPHLPLIVSWHFFLSLHLPYSPSMSAHLLMYFVLCGFTLLSSGTRISLPVLQGTQRGAVKAAASPRTAPSLLAKRRVAEGQQPQHLRHLSNEVIIFKWSYVSKNFFLKALKAKKMWFYICLWLISQQSVLQLKIKYTTFL